MSMNDEQFEESLQVLEQAMWPSTAEKLRARDTAQREALGAAIEGAMKWEQDLKDAREALARAEAERDAARSRQEHTQSTLRTVLAELQSSQAQLAQAVGLLRGVTNQPFINSNLVKVIDLFLARHAQAEQQEAHHENA